MGGLPPLLLGYGPDLSISYLIPQPAHLLILFPDVAFETSKIISIRSDNNNSDGLIGNVTGSAEDNFNYTLEKLRRKNLNRVNIRQIIINFIRNKFEHFFIF